MNPHRIRTLSLLLSLSSTTICIAENSQLSKSEVNKFTPLQQLGKQIFFDENLSSPQGQSCASCHDPKSAFSDSNLNEPVSNGVIEGRTGTRNAPPVTYAAFSPFFHFDNEEALYIGGQFLDGRATNLSEQAKKPFLNPDEMNNQNEAEVVDKLRTASYANVFKQIYGPDALDNPGQAFQSIAEAVAAFENTSIFSRFSSKYDYFLAGQAELSSEELKGLKLFNDVNKGNCAACHASTSNENDQPLFTDFTYDNLGVPKNPAILAKKGQDFVDFGLGTTVNNANENGKFKVPTLRNIAKTAPYMHNGVFKTLREVVDFYNTRDTDTKWGTPEVAENVNREELGNLNLTPGEVDAIVAFLKTLTDGYNLDATSYYASSTGIVALPWVRIEGNSTKTVIQRALLKAIAGSSPSQFRLIELQETATESPLDASSIPSFSFENEMLEIPSITVEGGAEFNAQLKRVVSDKENIFELLYLKPLQ